jgi:hypothetical protein
MLRWTQWHSPHPRMSTPVTPGTNCRLNHLIFTLFLQQELHATLTLRRPCLHFFHQHRHPHSHCRSLQYRWRQHHRVHTTVSTMTTSSSTASSMTTSTPEPTTAEAPAEEPVLEEAPVEEAPLLSSRSTKVPPRSFSPHPRQPLHLLRSGKPPPPSPTRTARKSAMPAPHRCTRASPATPATSTATATATATVSAVNSRSLRPDYSPAPPCSRVLASVFSCSA